MRIRTPKDVGASIRDRRKRLGWNQATLAERVGVSRQWIVEAERGKPRAAIGLVLRTLNVLGVSLAVDERERSTDSVPRVPDIDAIVERARQPAEVPLERPRRR